MCDEEKSVILNSDFFLNWSTIAFLCCVSFWWTAKWFGYMPVCVCVLSHSVVSDWLSMTPCSVALQAPLSMGFPRQGYRNGLPFSPPGDLPDPGIKPMSPWQEDSLHWATWEALYTDTYTHTCIHIYIHYIYSFPYSFPKSFQDFEYSSLCYTVETINSCLSILFANPKLLIYPSSTLFPLGNCMFPMSVLNSDF